MRSTCETALLSTLARSDLVCPLDGGLKNEDEPDALGLLVKVLELVTSRAATEAGHDSIKIREGNGVVDDFSALPRLYHDAIVLESWEEARPVLCAKV